jgi:hypothetical protein
MYFQVRRVRSALLLVGCVVMTACTSVTPTPDPGASPNAVVAQFAAAWQSLQPGPIATLTSDPGSASVELTAVLKNLTPTSLVVTTGTPRVTDANSATATASFAWTLTGGIPWKYDASWNFTRASTDEPWTAQWASTLINPRLGDAQTLVLRTTSASDGTVVDRDNQQILSPVTIYSVVVLPAKVVHLAGTAAALAGILGKLDPTVTAASVVAGVKAAAPKAGYTVTNLRDTDYKKVSTALGKIAGLSFPSTVRNLPPTKDFAKMLLSQVNPVAEKMTAGIAGWEIDSIDATGADLETLAAQPAQPGRNVTLTLDEKVQQAAEAALVAIPQAATIVAIQPSTGEILAVAQNQPADALGPIALRGEYPPGSTFKVVTATAAFNRHLVTPLTQVDCAGSFIVDSRVIHNFESFDLGTVSVTTAFAKSCNTTFAKLATLMPANALTDAAAQYGIGRDFVIPGITTLTGKVPNAPTITQKAENGFGQGVDLVTPFSEALMAATVANGRMPMPSIIRGTTTTIDQPVAVRSAAATAGTRSLMRAVVTDGTGSVLQDAGTVYAKTGTADYIDPQGVDLAHAWTVGYRGDLAFSVLIVAGNSSSRTTAIADAFLKAVP